MNRTRLLQAAALAAGLVLAANASAQFRLPQLPPPLPPQLPALPPAPDLRIEKPPVVPRLESLPDLSDLLESRTLTIGRLLREHGHLIEADPAGHPAIRGEVVVLSPSPAALEAARAKGFSVVRESALEALGERVVVLRAPSGATTAASVLALRQLDSQAPYDFNHLYLRAGAIRHELAQAPTAAGRAKAPGASSRVGLIDGGVDRRHPALRHAEVRTFGCSGKQIADLHGTGVASLLVGRAPGFAGAIPDATLYAADVYCDQPTGGTAALLAEALAWMARENVPVVNVSLVGPANLMLERAVRRVIARGQIVVAAVGNDGPAAPPLYPAAFRGVIAVTAVDAQRRVLPEAGRGAHVAFAAPGADMATAASDGHGYARARGTSFAAPLVAGLLARAASADSGGIEQPAAPRALGVLIRSAIDLGPPGPDEIYGFGLVGENLRVDPRSLR
ncbi:MAG: hypothetical protein EPN19_08670 [Betaproteobacteria bacterium]|nr:MAG: hypothetical protein EPN19_08670 [Betaproteobacteria bacterium]